MIYVIQSSPMIEKFQRRSRKPFIIARHLLGVSHPGMLGHDQQNRRGLSSWFLRGRDRSMDHVAGLGPVRAASLEGRCHHSALLAPQEGARQLAAHDASTIHGTSHLCENDIARKSRKVSRKVGRVPQSAVKCSCDVRANLLPLSSRLRIGTKLYHLLNF